MMLLLFTLIHFSVDGLCAAVMAEYAVNEPDYANIVYYFGLYNLIAFGGQWLTGLILDRRKVFVLPSFCAAPLLLAGGFFHGGGILTQVIFIALGNCVFHVSAGIFVLKSYAGFKEPGIFVSSGAVGLALGLHGFAGARAFWTLCAVLTASTAFILTKHHEPSAREESPLSQGGNIPYLIAGALMLLLCVVLRGFGGGANIPEYVLLMPCVFMAGKSFGGIVCDFAGYRKTILAIFLMSFAGLQLHGNLSVITLSFAFNMTMPLTLRLLHFYFPDYPGLTFGIAAGCLLPGTFFGEYMSISPYVMAVIQFVSLFMAGMILQRYGKDGRFQFLPR